MFGEKRKYLVEGIGDGKRADTVLSLLEADVSRQYLQKLMSEGRVTLNGKRLKPSFKLKEGQIIEVDFPTAVKMDLEPVELPLEIVYEDEYLMVINKAAGVVVHPAEHGKFMGKSLVNAVLFHVGDGLKGIGGVMRPGIVHRLDKDTSGLIVVAKTDLAHQGLMELFKKRDIKKHYMALVCGKLPDQEGRIEGAIGRSPSDRKRMALNGINAKAAVTEYQVKQVWETKWGNFSLVDVNLLTGRTHQIRVHFAGVGKPLAGDQHYGSPKINKVLEEKTGLNRQFLHAYALSFVHPVTKKRLSLKVDLASDLLKVLEILKEN